LRHLLIIERTRVYDPPAVLRRTVSAHERRPDRLDQLPTLVPGRVHERRRAQAAQSNGGGAVIERRRKRRLGP